MSTMDVNTLTHLIIQDGVFENTKPYFYEDLNK